MSQSQRIGDATRSARESVRAAGAAVSQATGHAVEAGRRQWDDLSRKVSGQAQHLKERGKEGLETARDTVKGNPIASTVVAFGLGFLIAGLLLRRWSLRD